MLHDFTEERHTLLRLADIALDAVDAERCTAEALAHFDAHRVALLALGKAAWPMVRGAVRMLGDRIAAGCVIAPESDPAPPRWTCHRGDHPVPGRNSLAAGEVLEQWLTTLDRELPLLVLLSGGGSALVERPVPGMDLAALEALNRFLLGSGMDIGRMNAVRARFSLLKRGGMRRLAGERRVVALLISDVPGDVVSHVASGPLSPAPVEWPGRDLPKWLQTLHATLPLPPVVATCARTATRIIACNGDALDAVEGELKRAGNKVVARAALSGDAGEQGARIARELLDGPAGFRLYGGETSVRLPDVHGVGGRNQHLALAAARELAGHDAFVLALATDGIDGGTQDAGALVDGGTVMRIADAGLDASACLAAFDSGSALAAAGDVIHTGPTGTNVADMVIAWKPR